MTLEYYEPGGKNATVAQASRLVVRDDHGNAVVVAVAYAPGQVFAAHIDDEEFQSLMTALGVEAAVVRRVIPVGE